MRMSLLAARATVLRAQLFPRTLEVGVDFTWFVGVLAEPDLSSGWLGLCACARRFLLFFCRGRGPFSNFGKCAKTDFD